MKKILLGLAATLLAGLSFAKPIQQLVVFGDSLSDTGNLYEYMQHNLPLSPPYYAGRFSNGPLWVDFLLEKNYPIDPKSHLLDYAIGGAGILPDDSDTGTAFTLKKELNDYFLEHDKANSDALYFIWIGANNFLTLPDDPDNDLLMVNDGIKRGLVRLLDKGAKSIVILNLPDLGKTPAAIEDNTVEELTNLSRRYNKLLKNTVIELQSKYPDSHLVYFDVLHSFNDIIKHPALFGFTNINQSCYVDDEPISALHSIPKIAAALRASNKDCDNYLFFDIVHPTTRAHSIMADKLQDFLSLNGIEF